MRALLIAALCLTAGCDEGACAQVRNTRRYCGERLLVAGQSICRYWVTVKYSYSECP